jgi:hypothetical protein
MTDEELDPYFVVLDDYASLIEEYEAAKVVASNADEEVRRLRDMLVKLLPAKEEAPDGCIGTHTGKARLSYRPQARRQLDHYKLRTVYPSVYESCSAYAVSWILRTLPVAQDNTGTPEAASTVDTP